MKIATETKHYTAGINSFGLAGNIILAGVVFGALSPWWLLLSIPTILTGLGIELIEKKPANNINL